MLTWALWGVALVGVAAVVYIIAQASFKPSAAGSPLDGLNKGPMAKLEIPAEPAPPPANSFQDGDGKPVAFVEVSVDSESATDKARRFIAQHAPLTYYADPAMKLPFAFTPPAGGMPTTVIYGKDGREKARLSGEADWSSPEAHKLIDALLAED